MAKQKNLSAVAPEPVEPESSPVNNVPAHEETAAERKARVPKTADDHLREVGERYAREACDAQGALEKLDERRAVLVEKLDKARAAQARIELALGAPISLPASGLEGGPATPPEPAEPSTDAVTNPASSDVMLPSL